MRYHYEFIRDGLVVEVEQSMMDDPLEKVLHPDTGEMEPVRRLVFGGQGCLFKGKGWTGRSKKGQW